MCLRNTMNPTGGVIWRRGIEPPDPGDPLQFVKELWGTNARLRLGMLWEPPRADPPAGRCRGWREKIPGYPLRQSFSSQFLLASTEAEVPPWPHCKVSRVLHRSYHPT